MAELHNLTGDKAMPKCRVKRHPVSQPLDESYRLIPLTQGQTAIVDCEDYEKLKQWNWHVRRQENRQVFYAVRNESGIGIYMHRIILGCTGKERADHKNCNTLDNRKENLRKCTCAQNLRNKVKASGKTSKFKGVSLNPRNNKWQVFIHINHKNTNLGEYKTEEEAAHVWDEAAKIHYGEFARLNFS